MTPDVYRSSATLLMRQAEELTEGENLPIRLESICEGFEVTVVMGAARPSRGGGAIRVSSQGAIIEVSAPTDGKVTHHTRFTIAHELGHYLLWKQMGIAPFSRNEYWQVERLCNEFAANLLIPRRAVASMVSGWESWKVYEVFTTSMKLAMEADVSWIVAATRIADIVPRAFYAYVERDDSDSLKVRTMTCRNAQGDRIGVHVKIDSASPFGRWLINSRGGLSRLYRGPVTFGQAELGHASVLAQHRTHGYRLAGCLDSA